ncbi:MAG TPA: hypothetical protein V6C81_23885 [Planktothrix sp.]|jgi:hypothetical protein
MRKPALKQIGHRLKQTALAATVIAILPGAAAFAEHFKMVHPFIFAPSAESVIFCAPTIGELNSASTPTAEEYIFDQLSE